LVKLYIRERHSDALNRFVEGRNDLVISDLTVTEVVSALARRARHDSAAAQAVRRVQDAILARFEDGTYHRVELTRDVHRRAERFLTTLGSTPLRAGDALHLALASSGQVATVASFDARLMAAARTIGLSVYPDAP
jgi:predicted nucleic acid-binding protein